MSRLRQTKLSQGRENCCGRCEGDRENSWSMAFNAWLCSECRYMVTESMFASDMVRDDDPFNPSFLRADQPSDPYSDPCGAPPMLRAAKSLPPGK